MRKPDDRGRLQDILDAIKRIESYLHGSIEKKFADDLMRQDAIMRQIEIIGEAARNVSPEFQEQHPEIPWSQMIGMRNKIAHDYSDIDIPEIWKTSKKDIPQLKKAVSKLLKEL
jgi:uncharacterized protein with HEPN domain